MNGTDTTTAAPVATTTDPDTLAVETEKRAAYADMLRDLAVVITTGAIDIPRNPLRVYLGSYADPDPKATFLAARRAFPDARVDVDPDGYGYVEIVLGDTARLLFDKKLLGTTTTVTRAVDEFTIDPELLAPVTA